MSGFLFLRTPDASERRVRLAAAGVEFDVVVPVPEGTLLFRSNVHLNGADRMVRGADEFACFTGTFFFEGAFGTAALAAFYDRFDPLRPSLKGAEGQFCLVVRKAGRLCLFTDRLGMNKLYHDLRNAAFSSLFLGIAEGMATATVDRQGCYEYAWNGATMGERTFFEEVRTLRVGHFAVVAGADVSVAALPSPELRDDTHDLSADELVDRHVERCRGLFRIYGRHFTDRINLSMSGGYDSRLILALFLDAGVRPRVFSYGADFRDDEAPEVEFVRKVADGEGLSFRYADKSGLPQLVPEAYAEDFRRTYALFDGWKNGGIFDTPADGADRAARVANGLVKVNGSAGEIYRNFFYLPSRRYFSREIVWSFYARYDPRACTSVFQPASYERAMAGVIRRDVGASGPLLKRFEVELAYPLVRVRYWTARDVQLNQGFGLCLFPFLEPRLVEGTCDIPIALKSYGIFEGRMIRRISERLAAYPSEYGYDFSADPPRSYRLKAQLSYRRPPIARRYSYRVKVRHPERRPYFLTPEYLGALIDPTFPIMSRYFHLEAINELDVFNRIATMEYHCERHGARERLA